MSPNRFYFRPIQTNFKRIYKKVALLKISIICTSQAVSNKDFTRKSMEDELISCQDEESAATKKVSNKKKLFLFSK